MSDAHPEAGRGSSIKPAVERRLAFIDFRLLWEGRINRKDLSDVFQISPQQASADIAVYEAHASKNLRYDNALKSYVRGSGFQPAFIGEFSDRYLLQLVGIRNGWISKEDTWFDSTPPYDVVSLRRHAVDSKNLEHLLDAIRDRLELEIEYSSISSAENTRRWIVPHALAYSAGRWHVRAWSRERNDFRDFNLNRVKGVHSQKESNVDASLDFEWHNYIDLILVPNDKLSTEIQNAVQAEYNMVGGQIVESIRLSLVFYLMNEHNLDVAPGLLDPRKQQLVLKNLDEVEGARRVARKMSADALARAFK